MIPYAGIVSIYPYRNKWASTTNRFLKGTLKINNAKLLLEEPLGNLACRFIFIPIQRTLHVSNEVWTSYAADNDQAHCHFKSMPSESFFVIMSGLRETPHLPNPGLHEFSTYDDAVEFAASVAASHFIPTPYIISISNTSEDQTCRTLGYFPHISSNPKRAYRMVRNIFDAHV